VGERRDGDGGEGLNKGKDTVVGFFGCLRSGATREWEVRKFPCMHILECGGVDPGGC
jgi:hypothetical protein